MDRGWQCGQPPFAPFGADFRMQVEPQQPQQPQQYGHQLQYNQQELTDLASRALRVLLSSGSVLLHPQLRLAVLGSNTGASESSSRSKCLLELALASLVEQGLVVRQGPPGPFATLAIPDSALVKAEALAYSDFPDEGQLPLYSAAAHHVRGSHRSGSCLNRLRRHSATSPRQFSSSRMAGIEKASGRRSKRSVGDDISNHLQKKARLQDSGMGSSPYSPGGCMSMSQ